MSKIKMLIQMEMDKRTAMELADQYYAEAKSIQKNIDDMFKLAGEECGKTGRTIYEVLGVICNEI